MTIRSTKIATILMIGAAIVATPVLAQSMTSGNRGSGEITTSRDAPLVLPGELTPNTPKVDASVSRDIFGSSAQAVDSLSTVTLDRTGEVTETEASDAMRAAFETETKGNTGK